MNDWLIEVHLMCHFDVFILQPLLRICQGLDDCHLGLIRKKFLFTTEFYDNVKTCFRSEMTCVVSALEVLSFICCVLLCTTVVLKLAFGKNTSLGFLASWVHDQKIWPSSDADSQQPPSLDVHISNTICWDNWLHGNLDWPGYTSWFLDVQDGADFQTFQKWFPKPISIFHIMKRGGGL